MKLKDKLKILLKERDSVRVWLAHCLVYPNWILNYLYIVNKSKENSRRIGNIELNCADVNIKHLPDVSLFSV